jgi:NodT family efflux transporter outer membrane factor (OMF) lipoprotein
MTVPRYFALLAGLLSACSAGPDFQRPAPPATEVFTAGTQPVVTADAGGDGGAAQRFIGGASVPMQWWELFQSPALNRLVQEALNHSPTLLESRARLVQAQENFRAQTGATLYPALDTQLGVNREKVDPAAFGFTNIPSEPPFTLYNAQVNVSYTLDLFGANRRLLEGERALTEYQAYETEASQLTLAANVVTAAVRQAELQTQIDTTAQILQAQTQQLVITEERYRTGGVALLELQNQRSQLAQTRASLPLLQAQRQQIDHQLAVYTGNPPAQASIPSITLTDLHLPTELPLTLPSAMVRRRPDVRAAEALWHEASANVGVATANLFPKLSISASVASQRTQTTDLVDGLNVWNVGANLMQPIFHGGELRAQKRSAVAAYEASAAAYQQTVLQALQQVADSLRALEADALTLQARSVAADQAAATYGIVQQRYEAGGVSEFSLLDAQRQQLQTSLDRSRAQADRYTDTAALLQALGGGW